MAESVPSNVRRSLCGFVDNYLKGRPFGMFAYWDNVHSKEAYADTVDNKHYSNMADSKTKICVKLYEILLS